MMSGVILGAAIMLIGIVLGYSLANSLRDDTEEVARWHQEIDEINE